MIYSLKHRQKERSMKKVEYDASRCKGCHYCFHNCPKGAISKAGVTNEKGYETVVFDDDKCIACGICYSVCPDYAIVVHKRKDM